MLGSRTNPAQALLDQHERQADPQGARVPVAHVPIPALARLQDGVPDSMKMRARMKMIRAELGEGEGVTALLDSSRGKGLISVTEDELVLSDDEYAGACARVHVFVCKCVCMRGYPCLWPLPARHLYCQHKDERVLERCRSAGPSK